MTREERDRAIRVDAAELPMTFGLRAFAGDSFKVNLGASYVNDAGVAILYLDVWSRGGWASFAKGSLTELRPQVVVPQLREVAEALHRKFPGTWIRTDSLTIERVLELRSPTDPQPLDGGLWWRTHHLVRQLGGEA